VKTSSPPRFGRLFGLGFGLVLEIGFGLVLGAVGLVFAFALMLRCHTAPATAFAYLLFFATLRSITFVALTRERVLQFPVAAVLCMAASLWTLRSHAPMVWEREDSGVFSIAWRSALILLCLLAIPHYASRLAVRSMTRFRRPIAQPSTRIRKELL
jgi:hypothetical protein